MAHAQLVNRARFPVKLEETMVKVKGILDNTRDPCRLGDTMHEYRDKFELVTKTSRAALESFWVGLEWLGAEKDQLAKLISKDDSMAKLTKTLRLSMKQQCKFIEKIERKVEDPHSVKVSGMLNYERKSYTKITEYAWNIDFQYELFIFTGADKTSNRVNVAVGSIDTLRVITKTNNPPVAESCTFGPHDLDLTFYFQNFSDPGRATFSIDRTLDSCKTPRRNWPVDQLVSFCENWWTFQTRLAPMLDLLSTVAANDGKKDWSSQVIKEISQQTDAVFIPVVPFVDKSRESVLSAGSSDSITFNYEDYHKFIQQFQEGTHDMLESLEETLENNVDVKSAPNAFKVLRISEYKVIALFGLLSKVSSAAINAVNSVEEEMRKQIFAAIGKEVTIKDLNEYMQFHYSKIYNKPFVPRAFSHDVRRKGCAPEGSLSLELGDELAYACCKQRTSDAEDITPMKFALNASTDVTIYGDQMVHGLLLHSFRGQKSELKLCARARQFSSFILMIGTLTSKDRFVPKHSVIVHNKDDLTIPLETSILPSAQEFRDSIRSLSETQQRFAKAFREMQLQSTLFGMIVMPIRPLLERLLNLPEYSLTKEIQLAQDLMELFIEHQIPSDILTYSGPPEASLSEKIENVKGNVQAVLNMLAEARKREVELRQQELQESISRNIVHDVDMECEELCMDDCFSGPPQPRKFGGVMKSMAAPRRSRGPMKSKKIAAPAFKERASGNMPKPVPPKGSAVVEKPKSETREEIIDEDSTLKGDGMGLENGIDITRIPKTLDKRYERVKSGSQVRPVIIKPGDAWDRKRKPGLLAKPQSKLLRLDEQKVESQKAMDLIDALSRSGELPLPEATLHVVVSVAQCFKDTILATVVEEDVNPIEVIERTNLVLNATIQDKQATDLLEDVHATRIAKLAPEQFRAITAPVEETTN